MKKGDKAIVYNTTLSGKTVSEGAVTLISLVMKDEGRESWKVKFPDGMLCTRWVHEENVISRTIKER
jgi:hypothetical protein